MRSVILQEFLSVDGLAADKDGGTDFIPASMKNDQSFRKWQTEFIDSVDTILLGRVTYQLFAQFWPNVQPGDDDKAFADKLNAMQKVVFSNSLKRAPWGGFEPATVVNTSAVAEVEQLKQGPGRDMVLWGSLSLAKELLRQGVLDEVQLIVCPLLLGDGRKFFDNGDTNGEMHLLTTRSFDSGSVLLCYSGALSLSAIGADTRQMR